MKMGKLLQLRPDVGIDELGDEALAAACATGDHAAQSLLFERHVDAVYRFIARMRGSDAASIDDLVQATFIAAFQSAGQFRGDKLQSWLFGIAANVLRGYIRKEVARKRIATALADEPPPDDMLWPLNPRAASRSASAPALATIRFSLAPGLAGTLRRWKRDTSPPVT